MLGRSARSGTTTTCSTLRQLDIADDDPAQLGDRCDPGTTDRDPSTRLTQTSGSVIRLRDFHLPASTPQHRSVE